ncbi:hypothetical protein CK203_099357 [Vitis vinifera]|uniref:Uncharacterized protein n=1 Tax=Vitis vinifera TaxID=29760 RepID=A0A438CHR0_VITVI|nr:hypothetical protein CK203_099357 [Vitis vinifera]
MSLKILGRGKTLKKKFTKAFHTPLRKFRKCHPVPLLWFDPLFTPPPPSHLTPLSLSHSTPPFEQTRGALAALSQSRTLRQRASFAQRKYETRRPATTQEATASHPQSSVQNPLAKRARTSGPGESSKVSQYEPLVATHARASADSELPSDMSPGSIIRCPMLTTPPIKGNSDYKSRPFHSEFYFD